MPGDLRPGHFQISNFQFQTNLKFEFEFEQVSNSTKFELQVCLGNFQTNLKFEFEFENSQTSSLKLPKFENFQT